MSKLFTDCPLCDDKLIYDNKYATHMWVCSGLTCPFVAFEFLGIDDVRNMVARLVDDPVDIKVL